MGRFAVIPVLQSTLPGRFRGRPSRQTLSLLKPEAQAKELVVDGSPDPPTRATEGLTNFAGSVRPSVGAVGRSGDRPTTSDKICRREGKVDGIGR